MVNNTERLEFLISQFNVYDLNGKELVSELHFKLKDESYNDVNLIDGPKGEPIAYVFTNKITKINSSGEELIKFKHKTLVDISVFNTMVSSDPTVNKINTQWMLTIFTNLLKSGDESEAIRFVKEDLPQAEEYLTLFENNKRKKKFKEFCKLNYVLVGVSDPTNINQYKSLAQLYDAIDPFIIRDPSEIEKTLNKFVTLSQAEIPVRDRKFTVFVPKTTEANVIFDKFASWCTARPGNSMFDSYTKNNLKPDGRKSDIYIVINHDFFNGESDNNLIYQIHFETKQVRNRNQSGSNFFEDVLMKSEGVSNFFNSELTEMAKDKFTIDDNVYLDYLIEFGWTQALFDLMLDVTPVIKLMNKTVPRLGDMSKFKQLRQLIICNSKMSELHSSIGKLSTLESLALPNNNITMLPKEIGNLKSLAFMNLLGNKIKVIPDEIKYLDSSNGGSLFRLAVRELDIGVENYKKLKRLLPTVSM